MSSESSSSTTANRMRPSAPLSDLPPKARPISAVMHSGTRRLMSHGSGLRQRPAQVFGERGTTRAFHVGSVHALPQIAAGELKKHIVQAGPLERDVLDAHRQTEQIFQTLGRIARPNRRHDKLAFRFLNDPEALVEIHPTRPARRL